MWAGRHCAPVCSGASCPLDGPQVSEGAVGLKTNWPLVWHCPRVQHVAVRYIHVQTNTGIDGLSGTGSELTTV